MTVIVTPYVDPPAERMRREIDTIDMMRERFETWYTAELRRVRAAGTAVDDNGSDNVFWKDERGDYGVDSIHAAWIGWYHGWMDHRNGYGR